MAPVEGRASGLATPAQARGAQVPAGGAIFTAEAATPGKAPIFTRFFTFNWGVRH